MYPDLTNFRTISVAADSMSIFALIMSLYPLLICATLNMLNPFLIGDIPSDRLFKTCCKRSGGTPPQFRFYLRAIHCIAEVMPWPIFYKNDEILKRFRPTDWHLRHDMDNFVYDIDVAPLLVSPDIIGMPLFA